MTTHYRYSRIDYVRYGFTALMANEFNNRPPVTYINEPILDYFGMAGATPWVNLGYQAMFCVGFCFLAFLALRFIRHDKR
jgi:hypothetical protein